MKKILLCLSICAISLANAADKKPMLIIDAYNESELPKHFRVTVPNAHPNINWVGFRDLNAMASGQFSQKGLLTILDHMKTHKIWVVDLRQESHGFINGHAISWYSETNAANAGMSKRKIQSRQKQLLENIAKQSKVKINPPEKKDHHPQDQYDILEVPVHEVYSEEQLVLKTGLRYVRFYIQDHHAPSAEAVKDFYYFIKTIPNDYLVYFHCRGGRGRSTAFLLMYDIIKNCKRLSLDEILARHIAMGSKDLSVLPDKDSYKYNSAKARLEFIEHFYKQCHKN